MADATQITASDASKEVAWHTIFLTLLGLSSSTMLQPVGSVLGTNPISSFWLRASPLFCFLDVLQNLIEILLLRIFYFRTLRGAAAEAMERRFAPFYDNTLGISQKEALLRWIVFLMSAFGPLVQLSGASGVPWSKTWGLAYATSFVWFELMLFLRPARESSPRTALDTYKPPKITRPTIDYFLNFEGPPLWFYGSHVSGAREYNPRRTDPLFYRVVDLPILVLLPVAFFGNWVLLFCGLFSVLNSLNAQIRETFGGLIIMALGIVSLVSMAVTQKLVDWLLKNRPDTLVRLQISENGSLEMRGRRSGGEVKKILWPVYFAWDIFLVGLFSYAFAYDPKGTRAL